MHGFVRTLLSVFVFVLLMFVTHLKQAYWCEHTLSLFFVCSKPTMAKEEEWGESTMKTYYTSLLAERRHFPSLSHL